MKCITIVIIITIIVTGRDVTHFVNSPLYSISSEHERTNVAAMLRSKMSH